MKGTRAYSIGCAALTIGGCFLMVVAVAIVAVVTLVVLVA